MYVLCDFQHVAHLVHVDITLNPLVKTLTFTRDSIIKLQDDTVTAKFLVPIYT